MKPSLLIKESYLVLRGLLHSHRRHLFAPILGILFFAAAGNLFAQARPTVYRIVAKHSGKCLAIAGGMGSRRDGDPVIQWDCLQPEENQNWMILPVRDDYYQIVAAHSEKALSVFGGIVSVGNGAVIQQWSFNGGDNQLWRLECSGDSFYQFFVKHSDNKVLDINGGPAATSNGPFAQQWDNWGGDNQKFVLQPLSPGLPGLAIPETCTTDANIRVYARPQGGRGFRVNEALTLRVENNTRSSIYLDYGPNPDWLIREEGLQVERWNGTRWFPALPSACGNFRRWNADGTVTSAEIAPTRRMELRTTMNITRQWRPPSALGPGRYRLALAYYSSPNIRQHSFACSLPFEVTP